MLATKKISKKFLPDNTRVIIKPYISGDTNRIRRIINDVLNLSEKEVEEGLNKAIRKFSNRHKNLISNLEENFNLISQYLPKDTEISDNKKLFLSTYFSCEYSIQSAAFFNPSIIPHPNQKDLPEGSLRFILSFRSVGEGHISSIEFRTGVVDKNLNFKFDEVSKFAERGKVFTQIYDKRTFFLKLREMPNPNFEIYNQIESLLPDVFDIFTLRGVLQMVIDSNHKNVEDDILWLAKSNYEIHFNAEEDLSEKIIFPASANDSNGIEDARFVKFTDDNGEVTYYATYTAYNGRNILPQIIETKDFNVFKMITLNGKWAKNKGMALFPRKLNGKYVMISRIDGESLYIMESDNLHFWQTGELLKKPEEQWELMQVGNCGSPIETEYGWLLITHGVGPMREYSIGAVLLDIENPNKIIGNMRMPLITCSKTEREGYVPNVVYSCGSIVHNGNLIVPYAMSDTRSGIITVPMKDLFKQLLENRKGLKIC